MDEWYTNTGKIGTYHEKERAFEDSIPLVKDEINGLKSNLSPLTNLLLNVSRNSPPTKDIVFSIPATIFRPIPILAYIYAKRNEKSVWVFTDSENLEIHKKNYYLLNSSDRNGMYLFEEIPIGVNLREGEINAELYLPRSTNRDYRKNYISGQLENFKRDGPKIFLSSVSGDTKINSIFEKIKLDGGDELLNQEIDIDLIIFENIERFVNSKFTFNMFLDWTHELSDSVRFVFQSSNPFSKYISKIKENFDAFVLQFGPNLLQNNNELKKASLEYFKNLNADGAKLLNKYNVDRPRFYENITEISMTKLPVENINIYGASIRELKREIDADLLELKREYFSIIRLHNRLINLSINPSKYKDRFYDRELSSYKYYTIPQMFSKVLKFLEDKDEKYAEYIKYMIREIYAIYKELEKTKRYGEEDQSYPRVGKEYKLIETIKNSLDSSDSRVIVATNTSVEEGLLNSELYRIEELKDELEKERLFVKHIPKLRNYTVDRGNSILILSGRPSIQDVVELLRPYKEIIIITYEGGPGQSVKQLLNLIKTYSPERERISLEYLREVFEDIGLSFNKSPLFKDYLKRQERQTTTVPEETALVKESEIEPEDIISEIRTLVYSNRSEYKELVVELEETEKIEHDMKQLEGMQMEDVETDDYYLVTLKGLDYEVEKRKLFLSKTYLYLKDITSPKVLEGVPTSLSVGNYIILLGGDVRKSLLDLVVEMSGLEESTDKSLIESWSNALRQYMKRNELSIKKIHDLYKEYGGQETYQTVSKWIKGEVFAPRDKGNLRIIGAFTGDDEILENYDLIDYQARELRTMHQKIGRKINKIVSVILGKSDVITADLGLEEYQLYKEIKEHIYEIIEINNG